jgi:putative nucleotidyltransferase with HDIG domain
MRYARAEPDAWLHDPALYVGSGVAGCGDAARLLAEGYLEVLVEEPGLAPSGADDPVMGPRRLASAAREEAALLVDAVPVREELALAARAYQGALRAAARLVMDATQGRELAAAPALEAVEGLCSSVERNHEAAGCVCRMARLGARLYPHMVATAVTALAFARYLGLEGEALRRVGLAAFLHDIGKTRLPLDSLERAQLGEAQAGREMRGHVRAGAALVGGLRGLRQDQRREVRRAVLEHHENHDGTGYPAGLAGAAISIGGRVLRLADAFERGISGMDGRQLSPAEALARLYSGRGTAFREDDVERFVKCLGIYPSGSVVRLSGGETALVVQTNPAKPLDPLVLVMLDARGAAMGRLLDLSRPRGAGVRVEEALPPGRVPDGMPGLDALL